jgi:hypothetical protein
MSRRGWTKAEIVVCAVVVLALGCLCAPVAPGPIEAVVLVVFGWIGFLARVGPQIEPDWGAIALGSISLALFAGGLHLLLRWFYAALPRTEDAPPRVWRGRWTACAVAIVVMLFVAGISMVGVTHQIAWLATAKQPLFSSDFVAAKRMMSSNNLSQMGKATISYEIHKGRLPPGVRTGDDGEALHGWMTALLPALRPDLAEAIDRSQPWLADANRRWFQTRIDRFLISRASLPTADSEGLALSHYAGNVHVLGGTRAWTSGDMTDGASHTILAGEAAGNYRPWGHPRNWRDPAFGISASPDGFGGPWTGGGANFVIADGSVRFIGRDVDPAVLRALATPASGDTVDVE